MTTPPYGLSSDCLTLAAHRFGLGHFTTPADTDPDQDAVDGMTVGGVEIAIQEANAPGRTSRSIRYVTFPATPGERRHAYAGSAAEVDTFVAWAASAIIATKIRPDPRTVPLRLALRDPDTLTIVGQAAIIADDLHERWWCLLDDGERPTRHAADDITTALHQTTLDVDTYFRARSAARHTALLHAAYRYTITNIGLHLHRAALDELLSIATPGVVPAIRAVRMITSWTPAQVSTAIRRHYSRATTLIDVLHHNLD